MNTHSLSPTFSHLPNFLSKEPSRESQLKETTTYHSKINATVQQSLKPLKLTKSSLSSLSIKISDSPLAIALLSKLQEINLLQQRYYLSSKNTWNNIPCFSSFIMPLLNAKNFLIRPATPSEAKDYYFNAPTIRTHQMIVITSGSDTTTLLGAIEYWHNSETHRCGINTLKIHKLKKESYLIKKLLFLYIIFAAKEPRCQEVFICFEDEGEAHLYLPYGFLPDDCEDEEKEEWKSLSLEKQSEKIMTEEGGHCCLKLTEENMILIKEKLDELLE
ncbi:hypothetical protein [Neochlamydia sp. S13]|uniref:hypothetical protein n=1 Tax=Neochlamydia sp. S13 TaxID=1353976 RepID=UPI0005AB489E|nr:hypothetical protein [Neochlamydia sp. S13]BBI17989.1 hypothetical protein NCS13_1_1794 [Neochlamydia sp. S13]